MSQQDVFKGLYAITSVSPHPTLGLVEQVGHALLGGARIIQYRDKSGDHTRREAEASKLVELCRQFNAPLIINDDVYLAKISKAAGVHLGSDDPSLNLARQELGKDAIIGVSCYNRLELAKEAADAGANYVAFGRFFNSSSKRSK